MQAIQRPGRRLREAMTKDLIMKSPHDEQCTQRVRIMPGQNETQPPSPCASTVPPSCRTCPATISSSMKRGHPEVAPPPYEYYCGWYADLHS